MPRITITDDESTVLEIFDVIGTDRNLKALVEDALENSNYWPCNNCGKWLSDDAPCHEEDLEFYCESCIPEAKNA